MRRLVVVSNRVAKAVPGGAAQGGSGGLAVALHEALQNSAGLWFGCSGETAEKPTLHRADPDEQRSYGLFTLDLKPEDYDGYYNGFSNRTLWPALHYCTELIHYNREHFRAYERVNTLMAQRLKENLRPDDVIWIHDYHLMLLPEALRRAGVTAPIGFFLHTPFPSAEVFTVLPQHRQLVRGLCHCDLVGFQTRRDLHAFHDYIVHEEGGEASPEGAVTAFGRSLSSGCFPISIDPEAFAAAAEASAESQVCRRLARSMRQRRLVLGVDRLDYTKGLPHRFRAYEYLLAHHPELRRQMTFVQIASQSREEVPEYVAIRRTLEELTGSINGSYSEIDWVPLRYINRGLSRELLAGVLRIAQVGLVTPLRDGMNLVAKEFVAAQDPESPGVLVLSRFAGAAQELDAALIVNPMDHEATGDALRRALVMSLGERKERWNAMMAVVRRQDVGRWWRSFLTALGEEELSVSPPSPAPSPSSSPSRSSSAGGREGPLALCPAG